MEDAHVFILSNNGMCVCVISISFHCGSLLLLNLCAT